MSDEKNTGALAAAWADSEARLFPGDSGSPEVCQAYRRMFYAGAAACCEVLLPPFAGYRSSADEINRRVLLLYAELVRFRDELKAGRA